MKKQSYFYIASAIFLAAGALHLVRAVNAWDLVVGDVFIPMWLSWVVVVVTGFMAYRGYNFGKRL